MPGARDGWETATVLSYTCCRRADALYVGFILGGHACKTFADIITPQVAHLVQTGAGVVPQDVHRVRTEAGIAPSVHTGPTIFVSQYVSKITAKQGTSNCWSSYEETTGIQANGVSIYSISPRISYGCHRRAERVAVVLESHVRITRSCCPSPALMKER